MARVCVRVRACVSDFFLSRACICARVLARARIRTCVRVFFSFRVHWARARARNIN